MWRTHLGVAWRALSARRGRSALTVTSITLGTLAIVLMTSLAGSGLRTLTRGIEELGAARMVLLAPKVPERDEGKATKPRPFTERERDELVRGVPHLSAASLMSTPGTRDVVSDGGKRTRTDLVAADAAFDRVFHMRLARGRALTDADDVAARPVCVVGPELAKHLWDGPALGHSLAIGELRCRVVGELADNKHFGMNFGFDWNDLVVMPFNLGRQHDERTASNAMITLETDAVRSNDIVKRVVNARLVARRGGIDDFTFYDLSGVVQKFHTAFAVMQALVGAIAAIALLIGGVGVMNMMLVSVSERVREIGVRKALGATAAAIRTQFIVESALLSGLGGAVGVGLGVVLALGSGFALRALLPTWVVSVSLLAAGIAFAAALSVGVLFGWLPARRAARLAPVEAMRR